jgi:hypothetical protein
VQFVGRTAQPDAIPVIDHAAPAHHISAVADRQREIGKLLDQNDCQAAIGKVAQAAMSHATMTGARPADISSMRRTFGRPSKARAMTSICCSPPDKRPALTARRGKSSGKRR